MRDHINMRSSLAPSQPPILISLLVRLVTQTAMIFWNCGEAKTLIDLIQHPASSIQVEEPA